MRGEAELRERLRLVVLTHPRPACGRSLRSVVAECLEAGCRAVQLRDKSASAAALYEQALDFVGLTRSHGALLLVNDRFDVALAAGADGVHLGPEDLPLPAVRRSVPESFLIGCSTDDPERAREAAAGGADYLGVGAVYGTASKEGLAGERIGPARVGEVLRASGLPCVGIGGIDAGNAGAVAAQGAGVAVLSAVMDAQRPGDAVGALLGAVASAAAPERDTPPAQ